MYDERLKPLAVGYLVAFPSEPISVLCLLKPAVCAPYDGATAQWVAVRTSNDGRRMLKE